MLEMRQAVVTSGPAERCAGWDTNERVLPRVRKTWVGSPACPFQLRALG